MLSDRQLRLNLNWAHFYRNLRGGPSASEWVRRSRNCARRTRFEASLRRAYERWAERHRPRLPAIPADARAILDAVETESYHIMSLGSLNIPDTNEILRSATVLQPE